MELGTLSEQNFSESIKTNGFIDIPPANKASVSAIMGGFIKKSNLFINTNNLYKVLRYILIFFFRY